ncbi:hypothetical protein P3773_11335 [Pseudomonas aeruginosa]|nr:hypothetical protein [Pseudomonas aeruginosa]
MSNCPHEAWDFGALQCPDCGAVKGHVADADYAKLEAEAQALREEVAKLRARVVVTDPVQAFDKFFAESGQSKYRETAWWNFEAGFNLARLNGKTVSEGLLRLALEFIMATNCQGSIPLGLIEELRALLNQDKENGNG